MGCMIAIYGQLRKAIQASDKTRYKLWMETGIDQGQLARFMAGGSGLSVESTEKLVEALGLEIIIRPKAAGTQAPRKTVKHGKRSQ
jgi:hypothetical protein